MDPHLRMLRLERRVEELEAAFDGGLAAMTVEVTKEFAIMKASIVRELLAEVVRRNTHEVSDESDAPSA